VANLKEIRLSEFAEQNSTNADVKLFARHMIHDHSMANRKLLRMASTDSLNLPDTNAFYTVINEAPEKPATQLMEHETPENRLKEQQIAAQQLESFNGQTFDQSYADAMVKDHVDAIQLFQNASENVTNEDLKNFAAKTLPTLRHHYRMAQMLQNNVGPMSTNNVSNANGSTRPLPVAPGAEM
jgi:putative membrane protein